MAVSLHKDINNWKPENKDFPEKLLGIQWNFTTQDHIGDWQKQWGGLLNDL